MRTRPFRAARGAIAVLALVIGLLAAPAGAAAAQRLYFTTDTDHDVYSIDANGSGLTRHTRTLGNKDLHEMHPTARNGLLLYETRILQSSGAYFGGTWYFASGSHYDVVQQKGKRASLPFYQRYTAGRLPNARRYHDIAAPALAPKGALRVAVNCNTPKIEHELCLYDYASKTLTRLTHCNCVDDGGSPVRLSWSRNGRYIVFARDAHIYRYDLTRKRLARVYDARQHADTEHERYWHATVDPSGTKVAVQFDEGGATSGIRIIDLATGARLRIPSPTISTFEGADGELLAKPGAYYAAPSFSPDGTRLAISVAEGYNPDNQPVDHPAGIYSIDLTGGDFRLIYRARRTDFDSTGIGWSITWGS